MKQHTDKNIVGTRLIALVMLFTSFLLTGCVSVQKPDLVPTSLSFDGDSVLHVSFANQGEAEVPSNKGNLAIFIDGRRLGTYQFGILSNQSFRPPGGSLDIRTNFRMSGEHRRVAIAIDTENEIDESNEYQNTLSRTLTPPAKNGPNYIVSDLSLNPSNALQIQVKNIGPANSPANRQVKLRVIINEATVADLTPTLPLLTANGGTTIITPSPPISISTNSTVRVLLNANHMLHDIDSTNNIRQEILPSGPSLSIYDALLNNSRIANNIIWQGSGGTAPDYIRNYTQWADIQKQELNTALLQLERGENPTISAPPPTANGLHINGYDAWRIYLAHVAQTLWIDAHQKVPWRLTDLTDEQLNYLLDSRNLVTMLPPVSTNIYLFSQYVGGNVTAWNPKIGYEFLVNFGLIRTTPLETIHAFSDWARAHFIHISSDDLYQDLYGYNGPPAADRVLYPLENKRHIIAGCWGVTGLYAAVLRSVNIPVKNLQITLRVDNNHSSPVFLSVDKQLPHGDDTHGGMMVTSGNAVPISEVFFSTAEVNNRFINPSIDCVNGNCNSVGNQADYNLTQYHWSLQFQHVADFPLYEYARGGNAHLNELLIGPKINGNPLFVKPFFDAPDRAAKIAAVVATLTEIGNGDIEAGKAKVIARYERFYQNR
jgi:archaellum component FlaG (FlaF/FlaG flagellin family)